MIVGGRKETFEQLKSLLLDIGPKVARQQLAPAIERSHKVTYFPIVTSSH